MKNQKGITLVELLAAISILFIVSGIIYGVFFTFNKNYDHISAKNNLDQEANLILATIKQYHLEQKSYYIKYNSSNKKAFIGNTTADKKLGDDKYYMEIKVGFPEPDNMINDTDTKIDSSQPLRVYLKLTSTQGHSYDVETIVKRY